MNERKNFEAQPGRNIEGEVRDEYTEMIDDCQEDLTYLQSRLEKERNPKRREELKKEIKETERRIGEWIKEREKWEKEHPESKE